MRYFLLLLSAGGCLAAAIPQVNTQEIIRRSVAAIESDWSRAPAYSFQERDVISKHGSAPSITTYQVLMIDGSPYKRLVAINDRPLSAGEQAEEARKLRLEIYRRGHESPRQHARRVAKYDRERQHDHVLFMAMVDAFSFRLVGQETVDGHDCWVMDATPKPGYRPKSRETKVLTGMKGRLWIDKHQNQWVKVQAQVFKPVTFAFIARVGPGTRFELEQEPVGNNLWLPKHFSMQVKASALGFIDESSTDDETYAHYQARPATSAALTRH